MALMRDIARKRDFVGRRLFLKPRRQEFVMTTMRTLRSLGLAVLFAGALLALAMGSLRPMFRASATGPMAPRKLGLGN
jgi:hypothetical protein